MPEEIREKSNFIWDAIREDIAAGKNDGRVQTRFPPEPNGYLHIGHVKALSVDFLTAEGVYVDEIIRASGLDSAEVSLELLELEMACRIERQVGNKVALIKRAKKDTK